MPDHLHLFCSPIMDTSLPIIQWVSFWKSHAARNWPPREDAPVWRRDFWDTQLRKGESYSEKWLYVAENPVRAGLATRSSDWPYQGVILPRKPVRGFVKESSENGRNTKQVCAAV